MANVSEAETLLDTPSRISCDESDNGKSLKTETKEIGEMHGIVFDRNEQLRRNLIALLTRFSATFVSVILLMDVDFILGMVSPTGALRLVFRHIRQRKWTRTTSIVAAYIFVNVAGRLSVAIFGLTFNLPDESVIEYPHQVTDWNAAKDPWMASRNISCYSEFTSNADRLMDHAQTGLRNFATTLNITYTLNDTMLSQLEETFMMSNLSNITLDIDHNDNTVRYSYVLKEYHGPTSTSSNVTVHSSASCNAITIEGDKVHHWGDNKTTYIIYPGYSFFHQPNYIPEFFSTYIFNSNKRAANNTALAELWECRSRLTHGENGTGISGSYNIADADTPSYVKSLLSFSAVGSDWWVNRTAVLLRSYYALSVTRENPSYEI
ncbi:hypothetical protein K440DRAFT_646264 [Wilcoxina mikolae CBS 423.85]|nr:hypothetical protein K440DRAFT_646264 [Wilcoxina mikolae CBS 423.85]